MPDNIYNKKEWLRKFIPDVSSDSYDEERISRILTAIPKEAVTVLDIGFGGGQIFRKLREKRNVSCYGMDISLDLAGKLKASSVCVGDVKGIPFKDSEFDLVLAGDLIEHIKDDSFENSISEIARVSRKYILINSPYKDAVDWPVSLCGACKREFNIYGHMRRIDMRLIKKIFPENKYEFIKVDILGRKRDPRPSVFVYIARRWGKVYSKEGAVCPYCFSDHIYQPSRNPAEKFLGRMVATLFFLTDNLLPSVCKSGSEILILLKKRECH